MSICLNVLFPWIMKYMLNQLLVGCLAVLPAARVEVQTAVRPYLWLVLCSLYPT